ncbi:stage II sporulation protein D [Paenibacillus sp. PL2-23]|uniref:stage II sporulation protein D n=1 Tax=Paenibacillus sp. PL2-23 TaxID=2100729 RepID=UPI0030FAFE1B
MEAWFARVRTSVARIERSWWVVFGIGVMLGAVVFGMKVWLREVEPQSVQTAAAPSEERSRLWSSAVEVEPVRQMAYEPASNGMQSQQGGGSSLEADAAPEQSEQKDGREASEVKTHAAGTEVEAGTGNEEQHAAKPPAKTALDGVKVRVYLTDRKQVETVPLETYVMGVVAAEMPIDFHLEALKAQAVAARTYIVRRLAMDGGDGQADVLDTVQHQVYLSKDELDKRWKGDAKRDNLAKLKHAVEDTRGLIMTYEGEPIEAAFFSTSNGYTENSEDYWEQSLPYLRSVASPWDAELSPRYEAEVSFTLGQFYRALGLPGKTSVSMKILEQSDGKRIKQMKINGRTFSGREVRESLGLASSHFSWKIGRDEITFTTYGLGHGVGMSQWGANGMAQDGRHAKDILEYYYSGAELKQASKLPSGTNS